MAVDPIITSITVLGSCALASTFVDRRASKREAAAEVAYPPTGQMLNVGGIQIHAHISEPAPGSGKLPDLVLIHGAGGNTRDFTFALVDLLKNDYRVIAFDRPGLGWSQGAGDAGLSPLEQADILRAAAAQLGVTHPVVLGHSYGGAVAVAWALHDLARGDATRAAALVIVSGATMPWSAAPSAFYSVPANILGGAILVPLLTAFATRASARKVIDHVFIPAIVPLGYADYVGINLTMRRASMRINARQVTHLNAHLQSMAPDYPRLVLPVELIHGDADVTVPLAIHAAPLTHLLPNARLTVLPGAGHMPHHSHPEAVVAAIRRASARVAATTGTAPL